MTVWLGRTLILAIHERQIAEHGGTQGVRDDALLQSALARPLQLEAYGEPSPDLVDLAAALAHGIARNHPFLDGNKRTAWVACRTFLLLNEADLLASAEEKYMTMLSLAEGRLTVEAFAEWLRKRVMVARSNRVQEPSAGHAARAP
jgi:death-on-curing protein